MRTGPFFLPDFFSPIATPGITGPGVFDWRKAAGFSIAKVNRHTGRPHEHKREIARRLRQAGRNAAK